MPEVAAIDAASFPQTRPAEDHVREELARPWTRGWVARDDDRVVGYLLSWHVADELHVLQVATRPVPSPKGHRSRARRAGARLRAQRARPARLARGPSLERRRDRPLPPRRLRRDHVRRGYYTDGEDALEMLARAGSRDRTARFARGRGPARCLTRAPQAHDRRSSVKEERCIGSFGSRRSRLWRSQPRSLVLRPPDASAPTAAGTPLATGSRRSGPRTTRGRSRRSPRSTAPTDRRPRSRSRGRCSRRGDTTPP